MNKLVNVLECYVRDLFGLNYLGRVLTICSSWMSILNSLIKIQTNRKTEGSFLLERITSCQQVILFSFAWLINSAVLRQCLYF